MEIIHQSQNWIVIHKPAGLSVHNLEDSTNVLIELEKMGYIGFAAVHRLDKETSGLMILSNDSAMTTKLQSALESNNKEKKYLAVLKGSLSKDRGSWNQPITNKAEGRNAPQGKSSLRVKAQTDFTVLSKGKYLTLIEASIKTGRQHQIRKHSVLNKHQIIGDQRYGDKKYNQLVQKIYKFNDMALHSYFLSFELEGKEFQFHAGYPKTWDNLAQELDLSSIP